MNKNKTKYTILILLMWALGIKASISVFSDSNMEHYNQLPMWLVYSFLAIYLIITLFITIKTVKKLKNK